MPGKTYHPFQKIAVLDDGILFFVILYFIFINDVFFRSNIVDIVHFRHPDPAVYFVSFSFYL